MQTLIAETPTFTRQADAIFCEDEKHELIDVLANDPLAGEGVPHADGIRKLCFSAVGAGRRGGERTIYYYRDEGVPIYVLLACAQSESTGMTRAEGRVVSELAAVLKSTEWERT